MFQCVQSVFLWLKKWITFLFFHRRIHKMKSENQTNFALYESISIAEAKEKEPENATLPDIIDQIRSGSNGLKQKIETLNNLYVTDTTKNKKKYRELKDTLPVFMASGVFKGSKSVESLQHHSGYIILDFDHLEDAQEFLKQVSKDPHTHVAFLSPSGNGVKVICKVSPIPTTPAEHTQGAWKAVAKHYEKYGIASEGVDGSGKNVNRLCYLSYDPDIYYNPNSEPLAWEPPPEQNAKTKSTSKR